ncbi:zinc-binding dehydrogenase [Microbacterium sp. TNHR37B]|uniref:zinc-binding dehydrogenase n=1 Tax=Microbacterium sp. TNHR37B TaxID=1775956 RepID=UPI0007B20A60|nr:zinc-binding dehydrogenase [Microbacterium sp. TNHR37B]KZE89912.1 L-threonine 3-dehydrogenase [Microbacterium sp. TNHR37B]
MKAAILEGAQDARIHEVPEREPGPGQVKVRVEWAGICGSDLALYQYFPVPNEYVHPLFGEHGPHGFGHEFSGRIEAVGDGVTSLAPGDLVAVRPNVWDGTCPACLRGEPNLCAEFGFIGINGGGGGFSESVVVGADAAHPFPEELGAEAGAMVESTSVAWHAAKVSEAGQGDVALVIGGGPIGLGLLLCLRARGVERVIVSEPSPSRRELAAALGADAVDPTSADLAAHVAEATGGAGVDVAFDASGVGQATYDTAFAALRPGGVNVVVAQFHGPVSVDLNSYLMSEKNLVGSFAYTDEDFSEVIAEMAAGRIDPRPLISSRIGLDHLVDAGIEHLLGGGRNTEVKILVSPAL